MRVQKRVQHFFADMREMFSEKRYRWSIFFAFLLCAFLFLLPLWRIFPLREFRPFIPLHYNIYFGVDRLGSWKEIFILPILGLALFLFNIILLTIAHRHSTFLSLLIAVATILLESVFLLAMLFIVLLNVSYSV